jgi:hypothetical protein
MGGSRRRRTPLTLGRGARFDGSISGIRQSSSWKPRWLMLEINAAAASNVVRGGAKKVHGEIHSASEV